MQTCKKHGCDLNCMAGCNAHPSNWYCPECDAEEEAKAKRHEEVENTIKRKIKDFNLFCADMMDITLNISVLRADSTDVRKHNGDIYNPWENYEELSVVVERLMNDDESDYDMMYRVSVLGFLQTWREYVLQAMSPAVEDVVPERNYELLMSIRDELNMDMNDMLTDEDLENIIEIATLYYKECAKATEEVDDGWTPIVKGKEPEGKVLVSYQEPFFGHFSAETEAAYFENDTWRFWLSEKEISTCEDGVTHWMPLPERENDDE